MSRDRAMTAESAAAALARLYDLDLSEDPGDLDLYLALAGRTGGPVLELAVGIGPARGPAGRGRATRSPAWTSTRRCSPGPAPRPTRPGAAVARRVRLVEGDARTVRLPDAGDYRLAFIPLNSIFLMGTRARPGGRGRDARRAPRARAASRSSTPGCPTPTTSPATTAGSCSSGSARTRRPGRTVTKTGSADLRRRRRRSVRLTTIFEEGDAGRAARPLGPRATGCASSAPDELVAFAEAAGPRGRDARRRLRPGRRSSRARSAS